MIAAIVAIVALTALLAYREYVHANERKLAIAERAELAQRIQAPTMAVLEHTEAERPVPLPFDDDAAFNEVRQELMNRG